MFKILIYLTSVWNMRIKGNIMKYVSDFNLGFIWLSIWRILVKVQIYCPFLTLLLKYSFSFSACNLWCQKAGESQKKKEKNLVRREDSENQVTSGWKESQVCLLVCLTVALGDFCMCVPVCSSASVLPSSCDPLDCSCQARLPMKLPARMLEQAAISPFRWSSKPRIKPASLCLPHWQAASYHCAAWKAPMCNRCFFFSWTSWLDCLFGFSFLDLILYHISKLYFNS